MPRCYGHGEYGNIPPINVDSVVRTVELGYIKGSWARGGFDWGVYNYGSSAYVKNAAPTGAPFYPMSNLKLTVNGVDYDDSSGAWSAVQIVSYAASTPKVITDEGRVVAVGVYLLCIVGAGEFDGSAAILQFEVYQEGTPRALEALIDIQLVIHDISNAINVL